MTSRDAVSLDATTSGDATLLGNLLQLYIHDLSAVFPDVAMGPDGRFGYPELPLYSFDDLHPSKTGSYLVALVMYEQIYKKSPIGLPSQFKLRDGTKFNIPADEAKLLQQAAATANKKFARP